jgi:hypothetical protein
MSSPTLEMLREGDAAEHRISFCIGGVIQTASVFRALSEASFRQLAPTLALKTKGSERCRCRQKGNYEAART